MNEKEYKIKRLRTDISYSQYHGVVSKSKKDKNFFTCFIETLQSFCECSDEVTQEKKFRYYKNHVDTYFSNVSCFDVSIEKIQHGVLGLMNEIQEIAQALCNKYSVDQPKLFNFLGIRIGKKSRLFSNDLDAYEKFNREKQEAFLNNLVEELGDIEWYLESVYSGLEEIPFNDVFGNLVKVDRDYVRSVNIEKLRRRFPDKFSEEHSINRDIEHEQKLFNLVLDEKIWQ